MINCIYLHIPFCKTKCPYCSFCSFPLLKYKKEYIDTLIKEIKFFYKGNPVETIYFGGGTPSLLEIDDIKRILDCLNYKNSSITLEANPLDVTFEKVQKLKQTGINRISLGVQSFNDEELKLIRKHNKNDILKAIENIKNAGFEDFSIDLIYGLEKQTLKSFEKCLNMAIELKIPHISLYGLKIEKGTLYYKTKPKVPDSDSQADMYKLAIEKLKQYNHYEFSNFAKKGFESKHNLKYWTRENYFGFGVSASGFIDNKRYTNTFNFKDYINNPTKKDYEILSKQQQIEEEIFLGLRLNKGIDFEKINKKYNIDIYNKYRDVFDKFTSQGYMKKSDNGIKLTVDGILLSNEILCEFILV